MTEIEDLTKRLSALEQQIKTAKIYGGAITLALLVGFGLSWKEIPQRVGTAVTAAMEKEVDKNIKEQALVQLGIIKETAIQAKEAADRASQEANGAETAAKRIKDSTLAKIVKGSLTVTTGGHTLSLGLPCPQGFIPVAGGFKNDNSAVKVVQQAIDDQYYVLSLANTGESKFVAKVWATCFRSGNIEVASNTP